MFLGQSAKVTIGHLALLVHPGRKVQCRLIIRQKSEIQIWDRLHMPQKSLGIRNGISIDGLRQNSDKPQFRDRASSDVGLNTMSRLHPTHDWRVKLVFRDSERQQYIDIQQEFHGKSANSFLTIALVSFGTPGGPFNTGHPVRGSVTIFILGRVFLCGVSTTRPPVEPRDSTVTVIESPTDKAS